MERFKERIPSWAISAIINDDRSGLEDEEIKMIESWFEDTGFDYICVPDGEPYFYPFPSFGKACCVYDCECVKL